MSTWAIVLAAGTGGRYGGAKQYERLGDCRVLDWSLAAARTVADGVVLVVAPDRVSDPEAADRVVAGASTRSGSVRAGLAAVPDGADTVVVHDAARPLAGADVFRRTLAALGAGVDGAICAIPLFDTVKRVEAGRVTATIERTGLVAVQTPQAFRADALRRAHQGDPEATDDAALVEAAGGVVAVVDGDVRNIKITTPGDLAVAESVRPR